MSFDQFMQYLLSKGIDTVGPAAEALRQQEGIQVTGMPDIPGVQSAPEELPALPGQQSVYAQPAGGLPGQPAAPQPMAIQPQAGPAATTSPLEDFWGEWRNAYTESQQIEKDASGLRRQQFEDAVRSLQDQRAGPSRQERLLALSSALLSPTSTPGFKGALGNVAPVLAQMATLKRQSEQGRQKQLSELRQQYLGSGIEDRRAGVKGRMDLLEMAQKMNKPQDMGTWSEGLKRFIPKDRAVVVETGVLQGKRTEKLSDGSIRVYEGNGTSKTYDAGGQLIAGGK